MPVGRPAHPPARRDRHIAGAVGLHDVDLEQILLDPIGAVGDPGAVRREERAAVVPRRIGQLPHVSAIGIHDVDVGVAVPVADEEDLLAVRRERALGVVALLGGQADEVTAVEPR